jgi:hypothetical protein
MADEPTIPEPARVVARSEPRAWAPAARCVAIGLTLLALLRFYWFVASANLEGEWPTYMTYHDLLADGFRAGQLHLPWAPHPELLAQENPFDPAHARLWLWDGTLYRGRYYLYWGPVPALLQAAVKSAFGIDRLVGDQYLVFGAFSLSALAGALLIERLQRRLFPSVRLWVVLLAIAAFGCANPAPYLLATGGVYQASIAAAQAFLLIGLVFAVDAVWRAQRGATATYALAAAGFAWALSLGSRVSMAAAIGSLILLTTLAVNWPWRATRSSWISAARVSSVMAAPVVVCGALLLLYNKLRFNQWLNFGTDMMLTTFPFRLSTDYVLVNVYSYLLRPFSTHCRFPFISAPWAPPPDVALPAFWNMPAGYLISEPLVGWMRVVPTTWFIPLALVGSYRASRRMWRSEPSSSRDLYRVFCTATFAVLGALTGMVTLGLYLATMRYLSDVTSGLALLGTMGAFASIQAARAGAPRVLAACLVSAALLATIALGSVLGFEGYNGHFKRFNPQLAEHWKQTYSLCE